MPEQVPTLPAGGVLSVTTLNRLVRDCLEAAFPLSWVGGEISNLTYAASGHVYFTLKDAAAQVRCVLWRSRAQLLGWRLENGQKVEVRALVSFYEPRGEFQLNVESVRRAGQGDLYERFLRLKAQLEAEGLFAPENKRPLPAYPADIAIVTSLQAAALRDVLTTLHRRAPYLRISLYPTAVQGEGAGERIAAALQSAAAGKHDAIILCRGGGSIEDLWAFNEEIVARAIRACRQPVVAGIGHETDFTIADFAADVRAPTPTAAAELLSPERNGLLARIEQLDARLTRHLARELADRAQRLDWLATRLVHPAERLRQQGETLLTAHARLQRAWSQRQTLIRQRCTQLEQRLNIAKPQAARNFETLSHLKRRLEAAAGHQLMRLESKLGPLGAALAQLDPDAVLRRGYTLAFDADGKAVRDARTLAPGDRLRLAFAHGSAEADVVRVVATPEGN